MQVLDAVISKMHFWGGKKPPRLGFALLSSLLHLVWLSPARISDEDTAVVLSSWRLAKMLPSDFY